MISSLIALLDGFNLKFLEQDNNNGQKSQLEQSIISAEKCILLLTLNICSPIIKLEYRCSDLLHLRLNPQLLISGIFKMALPIPIKNKAVPFFIAGHFSAARQNTLQAGTIRIIGTVEAGFPSPAEEELIDTLSLDELLIENREASFLIRVTGDSMTGAGIMPNDMVIMDRGRIAKSGDIVIAEVDGEWTMKYLRKRGESVMLVAANPRYKPITPKRELKIAGVVTAVVRKYR
jgi:SOS-response transcriptional repressor LexA